MGIAAMVRLTRNVPKKLTASTLYSSSMPGTDDLVKDQAPSNMPLVTVSQNDYMMMMKRMNDLEDKVINLSQKPPTMPPEKEELLNAALSRVHELEHELSSTKTVHFRFLFHKLSAQLNDQITRKQYNMMFLLLPYIVLFCAGS